MTLEEYALADFLSIFSVIAALVHILGVVNAAHAVMQVRSSQGALAWSIALITFPWLTIPLYWVLGRNKFFGYAEAIRFIYSQHKNSVRAVYLDLIKHRVALPQPLTSLNHLVEKLSIIPFTSGNAVDLLIDGQQTYTAMLQAIESASDYILLQSYIINDDATGDEFKQALIDRAAQGVRIY
ncbi:MAG TPA: hypothetical protein V6C65_09565, partial [Allocoleopsis sp.]